MVRLTIAAALDRNRQLLAKIGQYVEQGPPLGYYCTLALF